MLPEKLFLQGLYSYQQPAEIDFRPLTRAGIFGIFGSVGSGKSSILEAITYALYGESNRLNAKESRGYNMMNLNSDELEIDFTFTHREQRYRFSVTAKRAKSNFEEVRSPLRRAFREENGEWVPLPSTDATDILGLKYEHFRQIVIIPQGKFQEFVHKSPTARSDMLQELFPLEIYDLSDPLKYFRSQNKTAITTLETQLAELAVANPEAIRELGQMLKEAQEQTEELQKEKARVEKSVREAEQIRQLLDKQSAREQQLRELEAREDAIEKEAAELQRYEQVQQAFGDLLERSAQLEAQRQAALAQRDQILTRLERAEHAWQELQTRKQAIREGVGGLEIHDTQLREVEAALEAHALEEKLVWQVQQAEDARQALKEAEGERRQKTEQLEALRKEESTLHRELQEHGQLMRLSSSFEQEDQIRKRLATARAELEREQGQWAALETEKQEWGQRIAELDTHYHAWSGLDTKSVLGEIGNALETLHAEQRQLEVRRERLLKQAGLAQYAADLEEGTPCPLCGSTHHPELYHERAQQEGLVRLEEAIRKVDHKHDQLLLAQRDGRAWLEKRTERHEALDRQKHLLAGVEEELANCLQERKAFPDMDRKALEAALAQKREKEQHLQRLGKTIGELDRQLQDNTALREKQERVNTLRVEVARVEEGLRQRKAQTQSEWLAMGAEALGEKQVQLTESRRVLSELQEREVALGEELQDARTASHTAGERLTHLEKEINRLDRQVDERLADQEGVADREAVVRLLQRSLPVEETKERIRRFREELLSCRAALATLQEQTEGRAFDAAALAREQDRLRVLEEELGAGQNRIGELRGRLADLREKQARRKNLQKELRALEKRRENLQTMEGLFRSRGFVQYVSTIYLRQLCALANERFRKLTANRLQLDLDEKYQFVVRDFLFGGRTRSIKTLSGGQTFQAALCLALALSEQIQGHQGVEQPFFFLDEGFGTLDRDSLALVFDTLQQLRQEHRTVGIISHVEALQGEIDHHLRVVNEEQGGSRVEVI